MASTCASPSPHLLGGFDPVGHSCAPRQVRNFGSRGIVCGRPASHSRGIGYHTGRLYLDVQYVCPFPHL